MLESLKKKTCLITGARTGIGLSIGQTLAKNGYRVIFSGRSVNDCKDTVNQLVTDGYEAVESPIDLSNLSSLKQHAERRNGRVIILGCGDRVELSNISSQYDRHYGRG